MGKDKVEAVKLATGSKKETLKVEGVLVHIGLEPNTGYLADLVPVNQQGQIIVNRIMESEVPYLFAAGDIRSNSPRQVVAAVADGAVAAINAEKLLQNEG